MNPILIHSSLIFAFLSLFLYSINEIYPAVNIFILFISSVFHHCHFEGKIGIFWKYLDLCNIVLSIYVPSCRINYIYTLSIFFILLLFHCNRRMKNSSSFFNCTEPMESYLHVLIFHVLTSFMYLVTILLTK